MTRESYGRWEVEASTDGVQLRTTERSILPLVHAGAVVGFVPVIVFSTAVFGALNGEFLAFAYAYLLVAAGAASGWHRGIGRSLHPHVRTSLHIQRLPGRADGGYRVGAPPGLEVSVDGKRVDPKGSSVW